MRSHQRQQRIWADGRDFRTDPKAAFLRPAPQLSAVQYEGPMHICKHECDRCRGWGWREDFYTFCTFVTREICLCYFSAFLSPRGLRLGWKEEGMGEDAAGLLGSLANHLFLSFIHPASSPH